MSSYPTHGNVIISLSDKTDLDILVKNLLPKGYTIYSTGGTFKKILDICDQEDLESDKIIKIENYTNFPEILGGRVKTLHPKIYGGLLENQEKTEDLQEVKDHNIKIFDYVFVNLYPFEEALKKYGFDIKNKKQYYQLISSEDELALIESIDIGGVSLMRASAKNYKSSLPIINPEYYSMILDLIPHVGQKSTMLLSQRAELAREAFDCVSTYDYCVSTYDYLINWFYGHLMVSHQNKEEYPLELPLKYGLNPHQTQASLGWTDLVKQHQQFPFRILNGKPGYINLIDAIHSYLLVLELKKVFNCPGVASFKHTSPAGVGLGNKLLNQEELDFHHYGSGKQNHQSLVTSAYMKARGGDPLSSFGDFLAFSHPVDLETANLIKREVSDGIIAPGYDQAALEVLKAKRGGNYLILEGNPNYLDWFLENATTESRELFGMVLTQEPSRVISDFKFLEKSKVVTNNTIIPNDSKTDLLLANIALKYAQSNNICYAYDGQVIGLAAGQQNRVDSVTLAGKKAKRWFIRKSPMVKKIEQYFKPTLKRQEKVNLLLDIIKNLEEHHLDLESDLERNYERENYLSNFINYQSEDDLFLDTKEVNQYMKLNFKKISMSSDAFFPFRDNIDRARQYGVKYVLHPGGSLGDQSCIEACNQYDMVMIASGQRMFYH